MLTKLYTTDPCKTIASRVYRANSRFWIRRTRDILGYPQPFRGDNHISLSTPTREATAPTSCKSNPEDFYELVDPYTADLTHASTRQ